LYQNYSYHSFLSILELTRLEINDSYILDYTLEAFHKLQLLRVFLKIVFPILLIFKFRYETMAEATLERRKRLKSAFIVKHKQKETGLQLLDALQDCCLYHPLMTLRKAFG